MKEYLRLLESFPKTVHNGGVVPRFTTNVSPPHKHYKDVSELPSTPVTNIASPLPPSHKDNNKDNNKDDSQDNDNDDGSQYDYVQSQILVVDLDSQVDSQVPTESPDGTVILNTQTQEEINNWMNSA